MTHPKSLALALFLVFGAAACNALPDDDVTARQDERPVLTQGEAAKLRDGYLAQITKARAVLRKLPSDCAARSLRERAFEHLYVVMEQGFGLSKTEVDATYRTLPDYVFVELNASTSKTCQWRTTTPAMYDIIMRYNQEIVDAAPGCPSLAPFKATLGDYTSFKNYAVSLGLGSQWRKWSGDTACPSFLGCRDDVTVPSTATGLCDWLTPPPAGCGTIDYNGLCQGNTVVWCEGGTLESYECPAGLTCGWDQANSYYWCL